MRSSRRERDEIEDYKKHLSYEKINVDSYVFSFSMTSYALYAGTNITC